LSAELLPLAAPRQCEAVQTFTVSLYSYAKSG
jgi:hypothetical protein